RARGPAPDDRAPGADRRARARQERLPHRDQGELLLSVRRLEEMSTPALDALDRARTVVVLTVSPLEEHGPHLPVGVDAIAARPLPARRAPGGPPPATSPRPSASASPPRGPAGPRSWPRPCRSARSRSRPSAP